MPKSNKFGMITYEESNPIEKVTEFLTANHFAAVGSPEHRDDRWTEEDVEVWRKSQQQIYGVLVPKDATVWEMPTGEYRTGRYGQMEPKTEKKAVPKVGELKRGHRHWYFEFDYSMPLRTALDKVAPLNIVYLEPINSRRAYLRYMCHLDNPEKTKYPVEDVISLGGVDISCLWSQDDGAKFEQDVSIRQIISRYRINNINKLVEHLAAQNMRQMYAEVKAHYGYWIQFMRNSSPYVVYERDGEDSLSLGGDDTATSAA